MSSGFISEAELAERRRIRQEEWEKARKPEDPEEPPEEPYDPRSLFERLEEQKQKRELEYQEAHKLKNMIKGLDDDEVEFLDLVDRTKMEQERIKSTEEEKEIKNFREAVATFHEKSLEQRISTEIRQPVRSTGSQPSGPTSLGGRNSQTKLLAGAVVRKRPAENSQAPEDNKKPCVDVANDGPDAEQNELNSNSKPETNKEEESKNKKRKEREEPDSNGIADSGPGGVPAMRCIGILPGLGHYHDSSDSEQSSDTDQELPCATGYDLLGRKVEVIGKKSRSSSDQ